MLLQRELLHKKVTKKVSWLTSDKSVVGRLK